jgi:hypothetical protein
MSNTSDSVVGNDAFPSIQKTLHKTNRPLRDKAIPCDLSTKSKLLVSQAEEGLEPSPFAVKRTHLVVAQMVATVGAEAM